MNKIVVALGGNALQDENSLATAEAQLNIINSTTKYLADIIESGNRLIIAHGNGPQVGRILIQNNEAKHVTPAMPLDVCGSMSQGMIGYHLQQSLGNELRHRNINKPVVSIVTQVLVDKNDIGFTNPTKPIGPFYSKEESEIIAKKEGYIFIEDSGRGFRRVVASPKPEKIIEIETIKTLVNNDNIVITVGGGGVPIIEENNKYIGAPAVIDKDLAAEKLAEELDADVLFILTAVDRVAINFGKPNQINLDEVTVEEMKAYVEEGHFAPGSMLPKVLAAIEFAQSKKGRKTIIASLDKAKDAIKGESGTTVYL